MGNRAVFSSNKKIIMYISLDRVDIELQAPEGQHRFLQLDGRSSAEMGARESFSTAVSLIRCLNPLRFGAKVEIIYFCENDPPPFLSHLIKVVGCRLCVGKADLDRLNQPTVLPTMDVPAVQQLVQNAMQGLAQEVMASLDANDAQTALPLLEAKIAREGFPQNEDEVAYWTAVLELGALAGAAICATNGGNWLYDPAAKGSLPFIYTCLFNGEPATANPLGKALKFIIGMGDGEEPSDLVKLLAAGK